FHGSMMIAPARGVEFNRISVRGDGAPSAIAAQASRPSSCLSSAVRPARASNVGCQSLTCKGALTVAPAFSFTGHQAIDGTRTPPSYSVALPARSGPLLVTLPGAGPPLSL